LLSRETLAIMSQPRPGVLVLAAVTLTALIGCSTQIDHTKVEGSIRDELKAKGVTMASLSCPATIVAKAGGTFACTGADDQGTNATFTVTMKDDQGSISWVFDGTIVGMKEAGDSLEAALTQNVGKKVDVKCPDKAILAKKDCAFTCDATVDGESHKLAVKCTDDKGNVTGKVE
jgi:hypothetical protein